MTSTIHPHTRITRNPNLIAGNMDGEVVMMSIQRGNYYGLGEVGSHIWEKLQTPVTVSTLCNSLINEYEIDQSTCETEVARFLQQLLDEDLVKISDDSSPA